MNKALLFFVLFLCSIPLFSQKIFSEGEFDYKKPFAPYEISLVKGISSNEFLLLGEYQKGVFKLSRFDEYFIDKWSQSIEFGKEGSFPALIKLGNEAIVFRFWINGNKATVEIRVFNIETGALSRTTSKVIFESSEKDANIQLKFSESKSHFLIYSFNPDQSSDIIFDIYSTATVDKIGSHKLHLEVASGKNLAPYLNDSGDVFVAVGDAGSFTMDTYYLKQNSSNVKLNSNFSFKRPADRFSSMRVLKQSESTYMVIAIANIEKELVGINASSYNVVLKSHLTSNTFNIDQDFISEAYQESIFTSENQKKKYISTPDKLINTDLQEIIGDANGNFTLIFEKQELPSTFHELEKGLNFGMKWKEPEEIYYNSEDIILINIDAEGTINWKKAIQKTQSSMGHGLTLSYLANPKSDNELQMVMKESAKGSSLFYFNIDLENGNTISSQGFIDDKIEINKNYCAWLSEKVLLLCGNKPGSTKRKYYFVEF